MAKNGDKASRRLVRFPLAGIELLVGVTALIGGVLMVIDPSGEPLGLSTLWLGKTPFVDYAVPGLALAIIFGAGNLFAAFLAVTRYRWAGEVAGFLGMGMMVWIMMQVWLFIPTSWLQPTYFTLGALQFILGVVWLRTYWEGRGRTPA